MRIYLDDERPTPPGWVRAYWPADVIALLERGGVTDVSLDHDLGDDARGTGYDVVLWREKSWRSPLVDLDTLPTRLAAFGVVCRVRSMEQRSAWGDDYADTLPARPWHLSPQHKPLTMAEAAAEFDEMGGTWTGQQVAAALRAMAGKA